MGFSIEILRPIPAAQIRLLASSGPRAGSELNLFYDPCKIARPGALLPAPGVKGGAKLGHCGGAKVDHLGERTRFGKRLFRGLGRTPGGLFVRPEPGSRLPVLRVGWTMLLGCLHWDGRAVVKQQNRSRAGCQIVALVPANQREIEQNGSSVGVIAAQNLTSDFYRLLQKRAGARVVPPARLVAIPRLFSEPTVSL